MQSVLMEAGAIKEIGDEVQAQYERDGFVAFENVLSENEVEEAKNALSDLVRRVATDPKTKQFGEVWKPGTRAFGVQFETGWAPHERPGQWSASELEDLELKVRKLMWFVEEHPSLQRLAHAHAQVRGAVEKILGEEAVLFQDMALVKPPHIGGEKPWHQDKRLLFGGAPEFGLRRVDRAGRGDN
jgi:phytanoyl-CoA hydroxylase